MKNLLQICAQAALLLLPTCVSAQAGGSLLTGMDESIAIQREGLERLRDFLGPDSFPDSQPVKRAAPPPTISFRNPEAQKFFVDGTKIPDGTDFLRTLLLKAFNENLRCVDIVNFDAGPSWAGLMPISGAKNETRKLFFWYVLVSISRKSDLSILCNRFWPTNNASHADELLFWTNGMAIH